MSFLTINGVDVPVRSDASPSFTPVYVGARTRAFSGKLRSSVRAIIFEWRVTTRPLFKIEYDMLMSAIGFGQATVSGDAIGGSISALVTLDGGEFFKDGLSHQTGVTFTIQAKAQDVVALNLVPNVAYVDYTPAPPPPPPPASPLDHITMNPASITTTDGGSAPGPLDNITMNPASITTTI